MTKVIVFCWILFFIASTQPLANQPISPVLKSHVDMLNELSTRRQINTLFANESSLFAGQTVSFVNTTKGNLSFVRRDMVGFGRNPIVLARVYDSSQTDKADFGAGWSLSYAQTIEVLANGNLRHQDESANVFEFSPATVGYKLDPLHNSDIKSVAFNANGYLQIDYLNGWQKQFQKIGKRYRLANIQDNNQNQITLTYQNSHIVVITGSNGQFVNIARNEDGRISFIKDNNKRQVSYHYNDNGLLVTVNDLATNSWHYSYNDHQRLHKVIDPKGHTVGLFNYGNENKVSFVKIRSQQFHFKYQGNSTLVKDANANQSIYEHNAQGITTSVTNAEGFNSTIVLNRQNQLVELWHNGQRQAQISYDQRGRPAKYDINGKPTQLEKRQQGEYLQYNYTYDIHGRLTTINDKDNNQISYDYDERGNLLRYSSNEVTRTYRYADNGDVTHEINIVLGQPARKFNYHYNVDGLLTSISEQSRTVQLSYNFLGKLNNIVFPDGTSHQYQYDALGFRQQTRRSDSSGDDFQYDSLGNLNFISHFDNKGKQQHKDISLNNHNQITALKVTGEDSLLVKYTGKGNPKTITKGSVKTQYKYDRLGRLTWLYDNRIGEQTYQYQHNEADIRIQLDDRTKPTYSQQNRVSSHNQNQAVLHYARTKGVPWQAVVWNNALEKWLLPNPSTFNLPDAGFQSSKHRRRLLNALSPDKLIRANFDKPSNSFYLPPEYQAVNCDPYQDDMLDCVIFGVTFEQLGTTYLGEPKTFNAFAFGTPACSPEYSFYVDGVLSAVNKQGVFTPTFYTLGQHSISVRTVCTCSTASGKFAKIDSRWIDVQMPAPTGVTVNNATGSLGVINANVQMPDLTFTATATPTIMPISGLTFEWELKIKHSQNGRTTQQIVSTVIVANNQWTPNWGNIVAGGNDVQVSVSVSNINGSTPYISKTGFTILGENPTSSQIANEAGNSPWFLTRLIMAESSNRQFSPSPGEPINNGNGFGLMQVDNPAPTDRAIWDWKKNIVEGKAVLNSKDNETSAFWATQVKQYNAFLAAGNYAPPPNNVTHNGITFSYTPIGSQKSIADGLWIKAYNSASTHWYNWNNKDPFNQFWSYQPNNSQGVDYVKHICQQVP